jgi:hypothetical protein
MTIVHFSIQRLLVFLACAGIFTPKTNDNSKQQIKKDKPNAEQNLFPHKKKTLTHTTNLYVFAPVMDDE